LTILCFWGHLTLSTLTIPYLQTAKSEYLQAETFPLQHELTTIGRHPCCEIVLDHGAVSREHARIVKEPQGYFVEDLHSRNGTYLNNRVVDSKIRLFNSDVLRICDVEFTFFDDMAPIRPSGDSQHLTTGSRIIIDDSPVDEEAFRTATGIDGPAPQKVNLNPANAEIKLRALIDIGRNLGTDLDQVLPQLLENLLKIFAQADCAYILLNDMQTQRLELRAFKHRNPQNQESFRISRSILEKVSSTKAAILSDDIGNDSRFDPSESIVNYSICSVMATPILSGDQETCLGVIQVDSRSSGKKFNYNDLDLLVSVAYQIAVAIENAQYHDALIQERIFERELAVAHKVQQGLLPMSPPVIEGYEFFDYYQPARYLGGDYYDFIPLPGGKIAVALGDVSGKGISAALLMAKLSAEVRYGLLIEPELRQVVRRLNVTFCENRWENRFITFFLAIINQETHHIRFANAGHFPLLLVDPVEGTNSIAAHVGSLPLGVLIDSDFEEHSFTLQKGQSCVLMSDGLTDAMNTKGDLFTLEGVLNTLNLNRTVPVPQMGRNLVSAVRSFAGKTPQTDDQCLVLFGRK